MSRSQVILARWTPDISYFPASQLFKWIRIGYT